MDKPQKAKALATSSTHLTKRIVSPKIYSFNTGHIWFHSIHRPNTKNDAL